MRDVGKIRIADKNLKDFSPEVRDAILEFKQTKGVASFSYINVAEGRPYIVGEGENITVIYGEKQARVQVVSENTVGASNLFHGINSEIKALAGTTILVYEIFLGKRLLTVYNYTEKAIEGVQA